jgi:hypothetical protein
MNFSEGPQFHGRKIASFHLDLCTQMKGKNHEKNDLTDNFSIVSFFQLSFCSAGSDKKTNSSGSDKKDYR